MSAILYARVSTDEQARRDLSIPAQLRAARRYADDHGLTVAGIYQDVASGRSAKSRPGLMAAVNQAKKDTSIDVLLVHRIDRLFRDIHYYTALKGELRRAGIRIVSVVEHLEASPIGEFLEHLMAAQAEFYSANLALEVKKGMEERLRRGKWNGVAPLGYLNDHRGHVVLDPARSQFIGHAFERWSTGQVTSTMLADELHQLGLVGRSGLKIRANALCRLLQNPFYMGIMQVRGGRYPGTHQPLVSPEIFNRCQAVFVQKNGKSKRPHQRITFLLAGKVTCPRCAANLVGEEHRKKSGKVYRYYRCHRPGCQFTAKANELDQLVVHQLLALPLEARAAPILKQRIRRARRTRRQEVADRVRYLRSERRRQEEALRELARAYVHREIDEGDYDLRRQELLQGIRMTEWFLATPEHLDDGERGDVVLLGLVETARTSLASGDIVVQRKVIDAVVDRVSISGAEPAIEFIDRWKNFLAVTSSGKSPEREKGRSWLDRGGDTGDILTSYDRELSSDAPGDGRGRLRCSP